MNSKTTILVNLPLLLLAVLAFPAHAATNPDALEVEQQQFLNASAPSTLNAEQDRFLQTNFPVERKPQPQYSTAARWHPQPVARPEVAQQREFTPAAVAQPLPYDAAPIQHNIEPEQSAQAVPVARPLPSLKTPEGYSRISPAPSLKPAKSNAASAPPSTITPISTAPPKIAFALPPSLDGFLHRLQLGTERLLYPLVHPVAITSIFGWRTHPIYGGARFHAGIDLGAPIGSPVLAAFTGTVVSSDWMGGYGNAVLLQHGAGLRSLYAHLSESLVRPGQVVMQGTVIGLSGSTGNSTGPHLHFEMRRLSSGEWVAFDPGSDLKAAQSQLITAQIQIIKLSNKAR